MVLKRKSVIIIIVISSLILIASASVLAYFLTRDKEDEAEKYTELREIMVEYHILARGIEDKEVIDAMSAVPRHRFVDEEQKRHAYEDRPLPIGMGQTISQPFIVALMTEELDIEKDMKVLEIGTGSGYQAAVLAEITDEVYTVEIITQLYKEAKKRLEDMYPEVTVSNHDGYFGWEEHAPFDRIIVTAAPDHIPQPLVNQLKEGGIMIIPVGPPGWNQILWKVTRTDGDIQTEKIADVFFVPFTRQQ